jgi:predicted RNase H-like nuclease (RuvC/YqgF family)
MGFLDELREQLSKAFEYAREKGELGARMARLRLEINGLQRDREAMFARLGRTYHANPADTAALEPLQREIDRLTENLRDRESVLVQLRQPQPHALPLETSSED